LANFGYKLGVNVENFKNSLIFWIAAGIGYYELRKFRYGDLKKKFLKILSTFPNKNGILLQVNLLSIEEVQNFAQRIWLAGIYYIKSSELGLFSQNPL
jgi:hypothetical protein